MSGIVDRAAGMAARTPDWLLRLALRLPQRLLVLWGIFKAMGLRLDRKAAAGVSTVMRWEIARPGGGADRWQVVIRDGRCRAGRKLDEDPVFTLKLDGPTFLELVTARTSPPVLFMSGRITLHGDLMAAARMQTFFKIPQPPRRAPAPAGTGPA